MLQPPSGTVTFLFSDIEGSTRLWEQFPEAMRAALACHDDVVRDAIVACAGHVVKTTGDGFLAAFADASDAVRAAVAAQLGLSAQAWPATGPLQVRVGIHTGPAEQRDGDYHGSALNRAARLMSAAHGGQVVVSLATEQLVRDALGDGVALVDLGEYQLRDVARPERVFQVVHPELRRQFPELVSSATVRGNLPSQVTSFVGREDEISRVGALLDDAPLITLIGVGGVGKTRLALQVAETLAAQFPDGTWFCDLAAVTDDESVPLALATALGVPVGTGGAIEDAIPRYVGAKRLLVVLDNCEHVLDAAGEVVEPIVQVCLRARVIATSREGLAVDGERLWPVRPLALPRDLTEARTSAPVALFVDRVRAARPDFVLDTANEAAIVDICRHLDGLPLAIELAAARARSLSPRDIADRLDERFKLLSGGRKRGVARHETLRAAVDWSYELLDAAERAVLGRVSVFTGGFTLEAAEAVADDGALDDLVVDVLLRLVDKSLVTADDEFDTTRYRLLETIRQYALERLDTDDETATTRDRHLAFFVGFAGRAGAGLLGPDENQWHSRTSVELDNLRAAVAWAVETDDTDAALRLATAFAVQVILRISWAIGPLAATAAAMPAASTHDLGALAFAMSARTYADSGDVGRSVDMSEHVLATAAPDDWDARALAELNLGNVALGGTDDPVAHYERAIEYASQSTAASFLIIAHRFLVAGLPNRGPDHLERALHEAETTQRLARETRCPSMSMQADWALGYVLALMRDPRGLEPLRRAAESTFDAANRAGATSMLALLQSFHATPLETLDTLSKALRENRETEWRAFTSTIVNLATPILTRYGDPQAAAVLLGALEEGNLLRHNPTGLPAQQRARLHVTLAKRLAPDELAAARARGAEFSRDEVIDFALDRIATLQTTLAED